MLKLGHEVKFYDVSEERVKELRAKNYRATINPADMWDAEVIFVAVPTPQNIDGSVNTSYLETSLTRIGTFMSKDNRYPIVVIRSTVVPSELRHLARLFEQRSRRRIGRDCGFCCLPEFATEIATHWTKDTRFKRSSNQDFIILGTYDKKSEKILEIIYKPFKVPIFKMTPEEAMFAKYANNFCLATRVSFWNQMFLIGQELGIDVQKIADILALDSRIGRYGTKTGLAYSGTCFPKDTKAIIQWAKKHHNIPLLKAVDKINEEMAKKFGRRE